MWPSMVQEIGLLFQRKQVDLHIHNVDMIWITVNLVIILSFPVKQLSINENVLQDFKDVGRVADLGGLIT
jgi:hypothetical protein